ncbi:hypothetical protein KC331_g95 [Hortaea werneckii]|nr:hypothetical protein KC331_g95 [Hortaea werneckii]KAI7722844.1 hypothetical protein KC353_g151 [Hortaea werneckii]
MSEDAEAIANLMWDLWQLDQTPDGTDVGLHNEAVASLKHPFIETGQATGWLDNVTNNKLIARNQVIARRTGRPYSGPPATDVGKSMVPRDEAAAGYLNRLRKAPIEADEEDATRKRQATRGKSRSKKRKRAEVGHEDEARFPDFVDTVVEASDDEYHPPIAPGGESDDDAEDADDEYQPRRQPRKRERDDSEDDFLERQQNAIRTRRDFERLDAALLEARDLVREGAANAQHNHVSSEHAIPIEEAA